MGRAARRERIDRASAEGNRRETREQVVSPTREADIFLWNALRTRLPAGRSEAFLVGMMGGLARTRTAVPLLNEVRAFLIPGLAALGVGAELLPLPEEDAALIRFLRERLRYGVSVPVYAFAEMPPEPESPDVEVSAEEETTQREEDAGRAMLRQGVVTAIAAEGNVVLRQKEAEPETRLSPAAFRATFTYALRLRNMGATGPRRANVRAALLRHVAFFAAVPDRALSAAPIDTAPRAELAAFLREIAGRRRDPVAVRLRRAADAFADVFSPAGIETAKLWLLEAVLLDLRLPAAVQAALLAPAETPLTDGQRRELIYLARAGTRDMKVLAARRLGSERDFADVCRTLEQLAYDSDVWVRAASRTASS